MPGAGRVKQEHSQRCLTVVYCNGAALNNSVAHNFRWLAILQKQYKDIVGGIIYIMVATIINILEW